MMARIAMHEDRIGIVPRDVIAQAEAQLLHVELGALVLVLAGEHRMAEPQPSGIEAANGPPEAQRVVIDNRAVVNLGRDAVGIAELEERQHLAGVGLGRRALLDGDTDRTQMIGQSPKFIHARDFPSDVLQAIGLRGVKRDAMMMVVNAELKRRRLVFTLAGLESRSEERR